MAKRDDENETTEMWREHRQEQQKKRASNRDNGAQALTNAGVSFESKNNGAHLIVTANGLTYDFYPGTGKYCERHGKYKRGIFNLLRDIRNNS